MKKTGVFLSLFRASGMAAVVFFLAVPASSRSADAEWETLNQETIDLYRAGNYDRAVTVAKRALEVAEKALGPDHPDETIPTWL